MLGQPGKVGARWVYTAFKMLNPVYILGLDRIKDAKSKKCRMLRPLHGHPRLSLTSLKRDFWLLWMYNWRPIRRGEGCIGGWEVEKNGVGECS